MACGFHLSEGVSCFILNVNRSAMSSVLQGMVGFMAHYLGQMNNARYLAVVSWTVLGYDWLISFDMEVAYIWRAPWSPGRIAYHFNRIWPIIVFCSGISICLFSPSPSPTVCDLYLTDDDTISTEFCRCELVHISALNAFISIAGGSCKRTILYYSYGHLAEIVGLYSVLLMRYWALHNNKRILYMLLCGLCTSVALTAVFVKLTMDEVVYLNNPAPSIFTNGCVAILPPTMWKIYVVPLIYDSILFVMTVRRVWVLSKEYGSTPLMTRLAENGALHTGVLVVLMMFACAGSRTESIKIASNGSGILGAMSSVVCSRIIFSLHTLADREKQQSLPATAGEDAISSVRFEVPMKELNSTSTTSSATERFSFLQMEK